jgi:hypothetical protein
MAKNNYELSFPRCGDCGAPGVLVENHGELVVAFELAREPSLDEAMQLRRAIRDDKPPSLIRETDAGWLRQLEISNGGRKQC